jgi:hypothetical protein
MARRPAALQTKNKAAEKTAGGRRQKQTAVTPE